MKIVMISDTHTYEHELDLPDGDLLIHSGDFTLEGKAHEVYDFNNWLGKQKQFNDKIVIAGNHDLCVGEDPMFGYKHLTNAIYLQNSGIQIDDTYFWGSPMTPSFHGMRGGLTFYTNSDGEAKKAWAGMPKKTNFLITHGPPHGILDEVYRSRYHKGIDPEILVEHVGDKMLLDKVRKIKPKYHQFGHIHEGYGIMETDITTFINASCVNSAYGMENEPLVIYI